MTKALYRREFIQGSLAGTALTLGLNGKAQGERSTVAPSDQILVGSIGMGRQGMYNTRKFTDFPEVRIAAVCDVYEPHLERARTEFGAEGYSDFRKILERSDIDAVIVSTPDHWHPYMTIAACQAGKDVYVEKPVSVSVRDGRKMVDAARRHQRVVQVGTQQRSGGHFEKAVELVRSGELGRISNIRTWIFTNETPGGIGNPPDSDPPPDLDWEMWLGPAPGVPFNPNRFGVHPERWSTFRYFWDYAGGMMTDWGVHLLDIVQWAMHEDSPLAVCAVGGKSVIDDNRDTPDNLTVVYEYSGFTCTFETRSTNSRGISGHGYGIEFYGTEASLFLDRSGFEVLPEHFRRQEQQIPRSYRMEQANTNDHNHDHVRNFLDCIVSRGKPVADIEVGHTSTSTCLLANISYLTGRKLFWDGAREDFSKDSEASRLLSLHHRDPWRI